MKLFEIINVLESHAPLSLQESYDNSGLITGNPEMEIDKALISLDITPDVLHEALRKGCQLIIAHHPLIFKPLKRLSGANYVERMVIEAVKNDIALYAIHTNLDSVDRGVSTALALNLGLKNLKILEPRRGLLKKLVTFCPLKQADSLRQALFEAGAGKIGNYDACSFNVNGTGSFRAGEGADPFAGEIGKLHYEEEERIETVFPAWLTKKVIDALLHAHPYEEVAYDIYSIDNELPAVGMGVIGELEVEETELNFLSKVKEITGAGVIKYSPLKGVKIKRVAACGGSGSFLIHQAIRSGADIFITGDLKYHDYFEAEGKILLADIGHYESEQFAKSLIHSILSEKFTNFASLISEIRTNPINCL
ncbi:MAG: Nif3-like dinuclear metal center hexameric protein [Bacteroidales bacterium]